MATYTYALWNNKGGVGKSNLTFQLACEYARKHPDKKILVVDLCPQANSSGMLLGGIEKGEAALQEIFLRTGRPTIAGYVRDRIASPYHNPHLGTKYLTQVSLWNSKVPPNLYLIVGDEELEMLASRVTKATSPGPDNAWALVHGWVRELIEDIKKSWNGNAASVFIDCNPSFSIYTELALAAADRLIVPFSADGSSKRAVRSVLTLIYGVSRTKGSEVSEFHRSCEEFNCRVPQIYCYVGNRLTQENYTSAKAYRAVVNTIGQEIHAVWKEHPNYFCIHGAEIPKNQSEFKSMFQFEVKDANTASVVSGTLGIPLYSLKPAAYDLPGKQGVQVNESQLYRLKPNIEEFADLIE